MKIRKNKGNGNFGNKLEEVVRLKDKAKVQTQKLEVDYPTEALTTGKRVLDKLQKEFERVETDETYNKLQFAENIYRILVETQYKNLERVKEDYDIWSDLNNKFNS